MWELVAPASFDVQVEGHSLQIGREQGEYIVFALMLERLWRSQASQGLKLLGIGTAELLTYVERLPEVVIRGYRKKRPYLSSMLSKNEEASRTLGTRRLFSRQLHGSYVFNPKVLLWVEAGSAGSWVGVDELFGMSLRLAPVRFTAMRRTRSP